MKEILRSLALLFKLHRMGWQVEKQIRENERHLHDWKVLKEEMGKWDFKPKERRR
jgi:hypothetical protein